MSVDDTETTDHLEARLREHLRQSPEDARVWLELGSVRHRTGRIEAAVDAYQRAVELDREQVDAFVNWSTALSDLGRHDEAATVCDTGLKEHPTSADLWYARANAESARGRKSVAVAAYRRVLELAPDHADAFTNLGVTLAGLGRLDEAVENLRQAVRLNPESPRAHLNLGVALLERGEWDVAIGSLNEALGRRPDYAEAHYNLGSALVRTGRAEEGIASFRRALDHEPLHVGALNNLGLALKDGRRPEEAVVLLQQAARLQPTRVDAHNNLGLALADLGRFDEAERCYLRALEIDPRFADAHSNLGSTYKERGRLEEAIACYDMALRLAPDAPSTRWNRALALLQRGDFEAGWNEYEWRWRRRTSQPRTFDRPRWDGSKPGERTILLHCEQGLGDTLQFVRYASSLAGNGARVVIECPSILVKMLSTCPGIDTVVPEGAELPAFDVHAPLMSLPALCGTRLDSVPADVPYLFPDEDRRAAWRVELGDDDLFRIGICWQGNPYHPWDRHRSLPLEAFEPLAMIDGVRLFSLQKNFGLDQLDQPRRFDVMVLRDDLDEGPDAFLDTAALMAELDLVVSVDTAIVHLAGACGRPVFPLLSAIADWRWMRDREDSPWYPSARLFRQRRLGDWDEVLGRVARAVAERVAAGPRRGTVRMDVSPSTLLDRLTILAIKRERMTDPESLRNVEAEWATLAPVRVTSIPDVSGLDGLVERLRAINQRLWDLEDEVRVCERDGRFDDAFVRSARAIASTNDERAAVKRAIDALLSAPFTDPKSHETP